MSGYKFVIFVLVLIILILIWIPMYFMVVEPFGTAMNSLATDPDVIAKNNIAIAIAYYTPFIFFILLLIWILKSTLGNKEEAYTYAESY